jgi:hypothetical protein
MLRRDSTTMAWTRWYFSFLIGMKGQRQSRWTGRISPGASGTADVCPCRALGVDGGYVKHASKMEPKTQ